MVNLFLTDRRYFAYSLCNLFFWAISSFISDVIYGLARALNFRDLCIRMKKGLSEVVNIV